jgi:heme oxygenase
MTMTDITIEDVVAQLATARVDLDAAKAATRTATARVSAIHSDLESAVMELEDDEVAEAIVDFLNANTPWEFSLEREFEVRCSMVIRVNARNADAAEQAVLDSHYTATDRDLEIENVEVDSVELA